MRVRGACGDVFVRLRETDDGVPSAEFEGEKGPAEVVPVDYEGGVADEADEFGDGEEGDRGRVLDEHVLCGERAVAEGVVEGEGLLEDFEGAEKEEEDAVGGLEVTWRGS